MYDTLVHGLEYGHAFQHSRYLWLTAVVALVSTVWTGRVEMRRQAVKWAEQRAKLEVQSLSALAMREARIRGLNEQNALLQHQLVVINERQRELEEAHRREIAAAEARFRTPPPILGGFPVGDEREK